MIFRRKRAPSHPSGLRVGGVLIPWLACCQGLFVSGQPGSGKSHFLLSLIRQLIGRAHLVITTTKSTDLADVERVCREAGQIHRLVRLGQGSPHRLDIGDAFTAALPGACIRQLAHVTNMAGEVLNNAKGGHGGERFWDNAIADCIIRSGDLCKLATGRVRLDELLDVIQAMPGTPELFASDAFFADTACGRMLVGAKANRRPETDHVYVECVEFCSRMSGIGHKAHAAIVQGAGSILSGLVAEFAPQICRGSTIDLGYLERRKAVLVIDGRPVERHAAGKVFNFLNVAAVQMYCMVRDPGPLDIPTFLIRDEAGWILNGSHDASIQAVSRSQKLASVAAVQNMRILATGLGGNERAKMEAEAFVSMHNHKFFFANTCMESNQLASRLCGESPRIMLSGGGGQAEGRGFLAGALGVSTPGWHQQMMANIQPHEFAGLGVGECVMVANGDYRFLDLKEKRR